MQDSGPLFVGRGGVEERQCIHSEARSPVDIGGRLSVRDSAMYVSNHQNSSTSSKDHEVHMLHSPGFLVVHALNSTST